MLRQYLKTRWPLISRLMRYWGELRLLRFNIYRPFANHAIRKLCASGLTTNPQSRYVVCEALWDHPFHWFRLALFAPLLARYLDSRLFGLYERATSSRAVASLKSLPLADSVCIDEHPTEAHFERAQALLADVHSAEDIINLKLPFGYPGHLLYDGILKSEALGTIDGDFPRLAGYLAQTLAYLDQYSPLITPEKVSAVIVSHPVHFRLSTLTYLSLARGLPVYVLNYVNEHITIRRLKTPHHMVQGAFERPEFADVAKLDPEVKTQLARIGKDYLDLIRAGTSSEGSIVGVYDGKSANADARSQFLAQLGLDEAKPTVVIMTNCWPDFPNVYFPGWYTDYVDWFRKTLDIIVSCPDSNWIIRPHPAEFMYGAKTRIDTMMPSPLPPNIAVWPNGASGNMVAAVADLVVTAAGTAGVEYPALGKAVLIARDTAYAHWGFTSFGRTLAEYTDLLRSVVSIGKPSAEQCERAQIYLALTLCSAPQVGTAYRYPWGTLSYRLWPDIRRFIRENRGSIGHEADMMQRWLSSDIDSYNVFKSINCNLWGKPLGH